MVLVSRWKTRGNVTVWNRLLENIVRFSLVSKRLFVVTWVSVDSRTHSFIHSFIQEVSPSVPQWVNPSVCQSFNLSVCQSVSLSVCQSVNLSVSQSVSPLSVCQSVRHSVRTSVHAYIHSSIHQPAPVTIQCFTFNAVCPRWQLSNRNLNLTLNFANIQSKGLLSKYYNVSVDIAGPNTVSIVLKMTLNRVSNSFLLPSYQSRSPWSQDQIHNAFNEPP